MMSEAANGLSIQELLYPQIECFGCGHANAKGLHLRSYREGEVTVAEFVPWPEHDNGFGFLNGGIISTVLDCHTASVVMWEADHRGWQAADGAPIPFITAGFDVRFLRPTPLGPPLLVVARAVEISEQAIVVDAELKVDEKTRATMRANWARFRPR
jgi:acyl-coenzyme A thioesterase PaaI-like protein